MESTPQKDYVRLILVHSVLGGRSEKNFKLDLSVKEVKDKVFCELFVTDLIVVCYGWN